jgi:hypothetical protein
MAINPVVEKYLNEALEELRAQRRELDAAIAEVEATLRRLGGSASERTPPGRAVDVGVAQERSQGTPLAPPMRDAILEFVRTRDYDITTAQVVEGLAAKWDWQPSSVRSSLSKLAKEGVLGNPRRGVYNADPSTTPYKTSAASGVEPEAADETAPTDAQGGDTDQPSPLLQSDRPSEHRRDGHGDDRTSIAG